MKHAIGLLIFTIMAAFATTPQASAAVHWTLLARQVGQNEHSRSSALTQLRKIKDLNGLLTKELDGPNRFLALDVIVALKTTVLLGDLLERAGRDEDGFLVLAINSLLDSTNQEKVLNSYIEHLSRGDSGKVMSAATTVAMLDPLGRAGRALPRDLIATLLEHPFFEVRSAALSYARLMLLEFRQKEFAELTLKALNSHPYQLRIQALFLIDELGKKAESSEWIDKVVVAKVCEQEENTSVKPWCEQFLPQKKRSPAAKAVGNSSKDENRDAKNRDRSVIVRTALTAPKDRSCQDAYQRLYGKGSAHIRVIFGYKDTRPARFVGDRHERLAFVQKLMKPCSDDSFACGFSRDLDNADLFLKSINGPRSKPTKISLFVAHSSVSSDDSANREDPFQKWRSVYARKAFTGGLEKADVVFYNGHSRYGGGPDFEPPRLNTAGDVDQSFYQKNRPGLQAARQKLREREKADDGLQMLGLFSCASSQHFADQVTQDSNAGFVSSRALIYHADAIDSSIATLSALLQMRCEKDFKSSLKRASPGSGSRLQGFF